MLHAHAGCRRRFVVGSLLSLLAIAAVAGADVLLRCELERRPPPAAQAPGPRLTLPDEPAPLRYTIDARFDPSSRTIGGTLRLRFVNTSRRPLRELRFHLYLNAFRSRDTLFMRTAGGAHRGHRPDPRHPGSIDVSRLRVGGRRATAQPGSDPSVLVVGLPSPAPPGAPVLLAARFEARLPAVFARTGFARDFTMVAQWYPKLGVLRPDGSWHCPPFHANSEFFGSFADFRVRLTLPAAFRVGSTGRVTARARTRAGEQRLTIDARQVHDFALAAWPHFVEHRVRHRGVAIRLLSVPGRASQQRRLLARLLDGLRLLERWFGSYPYRQLTVVDVPTAARGAAAMEYPQLFTTWLPRWAPWWLHRFDEIVLHELTHQYFHGLVASNEVDEPWLDEGLTTFVSGLLLDRLLGPHGSFIDLPGLQLGQLQKTRLHQSLLRPPLPAARPAASYGSWFRYNVSVYGRAGALLYTVDSLIGRRRMIAALRRYVRAHAFSHPRGDDLRRALLAATPTALRGVVGRLLAGVLDRAAVLDYAVRCDGRRVVAVRRGELVVPLRVRWRRAGGPWRVTRWDGRDRRLELDAVAAELAPPGRLALDADPLDDSCRAPAAAPRGLAAPAVLLQQLLQGVAR